MHDFRYRVLPAVLALLIFCTAAAAQRTLSNIDDNPITMPNNFNVNFSKWAWQSFGHSTPNGNISHNTSVTVDGQSIQLDRESSSGYGDVFFFDRVIEGSGANGATSLTLDLYAALDSRGLSNSQALEFEIEQDVETGLGSGQWFRYIYGIQCRYKGTGNGLWYVWDGSKRGGAGDWDATTAPCVVPFHADGFDHYVFNFTRVDSENCDPSVQNSNHCVKYVDFFINSTHVVLDMSLQIQNLQSNWSDQLVAAIQLDGDITGDAYTAYADLLKVTYR